MDLGEHLKKLVAECIIGDVTQVYKIKSNIKGIKTLQQLGYVSEEYHKVCEPYFRILSKYCNRCEHPRCTNKCCNYVVDDDWSCLKTLKIQPFCEKHMKKCITESCENDSFYDQYNEFIHHGEGKYKHCYCIKCNRERNEKIERNNKLKAQEFLRTHTLVDSFYDDYQGEQCQINIYEDDEGNQREMWPSDELYWHL